MKLILARLLGVMYINEVLYFAVLSDRCLVDIYSASQYFHYFGKIVFSTTELCIVIGKIMISTDQAHY